MWLPSTRIEAALRRQPGPITPGLSAVYEYAFDSFEPKSVGTLTVYGAMAGAKSKCEMAGRRVSSTRAEGSTLASARVEAASRSP